MACLAEFFRTSYTIASWTSRPSDPGAVAGGYAIACVQHGAGILQSDKRDTVIARTGADDVALQLGGDALWWKPGSGLKSQTPVAV